MTTFEHAMLGINGALAFGLHEKFGWRIVALSGVAAVAPDWDGIPMLFDMARFESGHRVWGHNLISCLLLGLLLGTLDFRFGFSKWIVRQFAKLKTNGTDSGSVSANQQSLNEEPHVQRNPRWFTLVAVSTIAALTQIPADALVSGGQGLSDWALEPFWPFSAFEFVYPMLPWGNIGLTVIFAIGMLALAKKPHRAKLIAIAALGFVIGYIIVWGTTNG